MTSRDAARKVLAQQRAWLDAFAAERGRERRAAAEEALAGMRAVAQAAGLKRTAAVNFAGPVDARLRRRVIAELDDAWDAGAIVINFDSLGGSLADGIKVADCIAEMRQAGLTIEGRARGRVASAATIAFMECSTRTAEEGADFVLHRCSLDDLGERNTAAALRREADRLETFDRLILNRYQKRGVRLSADQRATFDRGEDVVLDPVYALIAGIVHHAPKPSGLHMIGTITDISKAPLALRPRLRHAARLAAIRGTR